LDLWLGAKAADTLIRATTTPRSAGRRRGGRVG
jgi:hypothetical protein